MLGVVWRWPTAWWPYPLHRWPLAVVLVALTSPLGCVGLHLAGLAWGFAVHGVALCVALVYFRLRTERRRRQQRVELVFLTGRD